jgi:hypothetical protein
MPQPAQHESLLEMDQTMKEWESNNVAIHAIKRPLPALEPGFWSP